MTMLEFIKKIFSRGKKERRIILFEEERTSNKNAVPFVAILSHKGGVGKSTIAQSLVLEASTKYTGNRRILVLDLDFSSPRLTDSILSSANLDSIKDLVSYLLKPDLPLSNYVVEIDMSSILYTNRIRFLFIPAAIDQSMVSYLFDKIETLSSKDISSRVELFVNDLNDFVVKSNESSYIIPFVLFDMPTFASDLALYSFHRELLKRMDGYIVVTDSIPQNIERHVEVLLKYTRTSHERNPFGILVVNRYIPNSKIDLLLSDISRRYEIPVVKVPEVREIQLTEAGSGKFIGMWSRERLVNPALKEKISKIIESKRFKEWRKSIKELTNKLDELVSSHMIRY